MSNVAHWPEEAATKPSENVPSRALIRAARIARVAEVAAERLRCEPDADAIAAALADLALIRELAGESAVIPPDDELPPINDRETLDELPEAAANDTVPPPPPSFGVPSAFRDTEPVPESSRAPLAIPGEKQRWPSPPRSWICSAPS